MHRKVSADPKGTRRENEKFPRPPLPPSNKDTTLTVKALQASGTFDFNSLCLTSCNLLGNRNFKQTRKQDRIRLEVSTCPSTNGIRRRQSS